jgi:CMP-2-keto-3-deoxyoctulosonic acid synthetase
MLHHIIKDLIHANAANIQKGKRIYDEGGVIKKLDMMFLDVLKNVNCQVDDDIIEKEYIKQLKDSLPKSKTSTFTYKKTVKTNLQDGTNIVNNFVSTFEN